MEEIFKLEEAMKVTYKISAKMVVEVSGDDIKDVMSELSSVEEVLGHSKCGVCGSEEVRHAVRNTKGFTFYEIQCTSPACRAKLSFGQARETGKLFPHRKNEDGTWKPNNGWEIWTGNQGGQQAARRPSAPQDEGFFGQAPADDTSMPF